MPNSNLDDVVFDESGVLSDEQSAAIGVALALVYHSDALAEIGFVPSLSGEHSERALIARACGALRATALADDSRDDYLMLAAACVLKAIALCSARRAREENGASDD